MKNEVVNLSGGLAPERLKPLLIRIYNPNVKKRRFQIAMSERSGLQILTSGGCKVKNFWLELLTSRRLARAGGHAQYPLQASPASGVHA